MMSLLTKDEEDFILENLGKVRVAELIDFILLSRLTNAEEMVDTRPQDIMDLRVKIKEEVMRKWSHGR